jgi:hypothetical protein
VCRSFYSHRPFSSCFQLRLFHSGFRCQHEYKLEDRSPHCTSLGRLLLLFHRAKDECKRAQNDEADPSFVGTTCVHIGVSVGSEFFLLAMSQIQNDKSLDGEI